VEKRVKGGPFHSRVELNSKCVAGKMSSGFLSFATSVSHGSFLATLNAQTWKLLLMYKRN